MMISIFTTDLIINYDEGSGIGYTLIADILNPKYLQPLHTDLPFFSKKIVINGKTKSPCTFSDKVNYNCIALFITTSFKIWDNSKKCMQSHKI